MTELSKPPWTDGPAVPCGGRGDRRAVRCDGGPDQAEDDAMGDDPAEHDAVDGSSKASSEDVGESPTAIGEEADAEERDHAPHDHHADDRETVAVGVVTVSTSRTVDEDASGDAIVSRLEAAGHEVATREVIDDDYDGVQSVVDALVRRDDVDAVVTTGGTGVSPDDVTVEAIRPVLDKRLPGFGELFRSLSREQIGSRIVATRATAGVADGVPVFCLPGSEAAVRLGVDEVIVPEVGHLTGLARTGPDDEA